MALQKRSSLTEKLVPILMLASIGLAFVVGILWQKVNALQNGSSTTTAAANVTGTQDNAAQPVATKVTTDQIKGLFDKDLVTFGDANRKVLFVEVADPSCPYCHVAAGKNPELNAQIGPQFKLVSDGGTYVPPVIEMKKLVDSGKASFVFIYSNGHGNGEMGTKAMYCAYEKGKFWEVHDLLMSSKGYAFLNETVKNDKTKSQQLADFVKSAVDPSFMKSCLDSGKYDNRITEDQTLASSLGVSGTPGFFVNETNFAGAYSFKDMEAAVNTLLEN